MNPSDTGEWNACIDRLYDAVGREDQLSQALGHFLPLFDARGVTYLSIPDSRHPTTWHSGAIGVAQQSLVEYHAHFNAYDEWVQAASARSDFGPGAIYRGSELVPARRLRRSYFWNAFVKRTGVIDILTAVVEASTLDGPSSFLTFHRHRGQRPYAVADAHRLRVLAPHLARVLRLHRRLAPALALGATLQQLVQQLEVPLFFVAADGRPVQINPAAQAAMAQADPCLRLHAGRVQWAQAGLWNELAASLAPLAGADRPSVEIELTGALGRRATLDVRRVHGALTDRIATHPAVAVCTMRPLPTDVAQRLRQGYGLTAAEARVAMLLAAGHNLRQVAQMRSLAVSTVRTQLQAALQKTGLQRQAQLVALIVAL